MGTADGAEIGRSTADSIVAGGARDVTLLWDASDQIPGAWVQVFAVADDLAEVVEADETNNVHHLTVMIPEVTAGDLNRDGAISLDDFGIWASCMAGPGESTPPDGCDPVDFALADFDEDLDVDSPDFAAMQRILPGPQG